MSDFSTLCHVPSGTIRTRRASLLSLIRDMIEVRRQRRALSSLDDALLRDIGVSPEEARREVDKPAWDVPVTWRR